MIDKVTIIASAKDGDRTVDILDDTVRARKQHGLSPRARLAAQQDAAPQDTAQQDQLMAEKIAMEMEIMELQDMP